MKNDEVKVSSPSSRLSSTSAFDTLQGGLRSRESRCSRGVLPLQGNYPPDASRVPLQSPCARPRRSEPEGRRDKTPDIAARPKTSRTPSWRSVTTRATPTPKSKGRRASPPEDEREEKGDETCPSCRFELH